MYELFLLEIQDKNGSLEGVQGDLLIYFYRVYVSIRQLHLKHCKEPTQQ